MPVVAEISTFQAASVAGVDEDSIRAVMAERGVTAITPDNFPELTEAARAKMQADGLMPVRIWRCRAGGPTPDGTMPIKQTGAAKSGLKLLWASQLKGIGTAYGVATHGNNFRRALEAQGVLTYDPEETCDFAIHVVPTDLFKPLPGKKNVLFTTCEMSEPTAPLAADPDLLVVPCEFNRKVFSKSFHGPIEVSPEGIDPSIFKFHQRQEPESKRPIAFLFNGNLDDSTKGAGLALSAWETWQKSGKMPENVYLHLKTTGLSAPPLQYFDPRNHSPLQFPEPQCIVQDNRDLSVRALAALYNSAYALITPSLGEGQNLVLMEAMASGLPCIWSHHTAMLDYTSDDLGFPVTEFKKHIFNPEEPHYYGLAPEVPAIVARMQEIVDDFPAALERGRRASEKMHSSFTWDLAAKRFIEICKEYL